MRSLLFHKGLAALRAPHLSSLEGLATLRVQLPSPLAAGISHAARAFSLSARRGGPCKLFEAHGLTAFGLFSYKSLQEQAPDVLVRKKPSASR